MRLWLLSILCMCDYISQTHLCSISAWRQRWSVWLPVSLLCVWSILVFWASGLLLTSGCSYLLYYGVWERVVAVQRTSLVSYLLFAPLWPQQKLLLVAIRFRLWPLSRTQAMDKLNRCSCCFCWHSKSAFSDVTDNFCVSWRDESLIFPEHLKRIWKQYFALSDLWVCVVIARLSGFSLDLLQMYVSFCYLPPDDLYVLVDTTSLLFCGGKRTEWVYATVRMSHQGCVSFPCLLLV